MWLTFELFVVWKFYIETRNTPLEEIVKHFDGENGIVGGQAATEKARVIAAEHDLNIGTETHRGDLDEKAAVYHTEKRMV